MMYTAKVAVFSEIQNVQNTQRKASTM